MPTPAPACSARRNGPGRSGSGSRPRSPAPVGGGKTVSPPPEAADLMDIPDQDPNYRKTAWVDGRQVTGIWHASDAGITDNFWCDGLGHMACGFFAVGEPERGNFYANQMDRLLRDIEIQGVRTRGIPYTLSRKGGYDWVDPRKGFTSTAAWYIFAKNRFNPFTLRQAK